MIHVLKNHDYSKLEHEDILSILETDVQNSFETVKLFAESFFPTNIIPAHELGQAIIIVVEEADQIDMSKKQLRDIRQILGSKHTILLKLKYDLNMFERGEYVAAGATDVIDTPIFLQAASKAG